MQRPSGQGAAFSIDSLIGTPPPRSGHLLYTGYPMFMPYRPLVLPQALSHAPLQSGLPPLAPLASFAGRLTNTFCASLGQGVPSMVALTTALPNFSEPPDGFYPAQELPAARTNPEPGCRRSAESLEAEELPPARDKGPPEPPLHFPDPFPSLAGKNRAAAAASPVQASGTFCGVGPDPSHGCCSRDRSVVLEQSGAACPVPWAKRGAVPALWG
ncbi:Homeobox protein GBX-1 [Platysternon megacephalum]|uniref:Homeobox protein GBX-1 n=1 Tax=Platysternon megacephalum TaxID=55544 RepID=A0A4D9DFB0_9SAUR|nr:Homeobox protein GBX-1 [Platysternon megacephalum]